MEDPKFNKVETGHEGEHITLGLGETIEVNIQGKETTFKLSEIKTRIVDEDLVVEIPPTAVVYVDSEGSHYELEFSNNSPINYCLDLEHIIPIANISTINPLTGQIQIDFLR